MDGMKDDFKFLSENFWFTFHYTLRKTTSFNLDVHKIRAGKMRCECRERGWGEIRNKKRLPNFII